GIPSSRYPPNRIELENQLACANRDRKIAIECGNQLVNKLGMRFRGGHKFKKSDTITLEPEPSNTYDKNAIKIMVDGIHKAYVAKDENVSIGDLMRRYPRYRVNAHGKKNYNQSASLNLEYPWMICERCRDTLQASRDYDYSYW
ncbi:19379_t:CDS:2, partial [Entrophospora sp. SA101]